MFKLLLISLYLWTNNILDFITNLLVNNSYNIIFMVINYLIKEKYYILYIIDEHSMITTETTFQLLI